jgi:hypothetical protein
MNNVNLPLLLLDNNKMMMIMNSPLSSMVCGPCRTFDYKIYIYIDASLLVGPVLAVYMYIMI